MIVILVATGCICSICMILMVFLTYKTKKVADLVVKQPVITPETIVKTKTKVKYIAVTPYNTTDYDFIENIANNIARNERFIFLLMDIREKFIETLKTGKPEDLAFKSGYINGIDGVLAELQDIDMRWEKLAIQAEKGQ